MKKILFILALIYNQSLSAQINVEGLWIFPKIDEDINLILPAFSFEIKDSKSYDYQGFLDHLDDGFWNFFF